jgi:hypothetical protein
LFRAIPYGSATDPRFAAVTQLSTGANSHYDGLQTTIGKRLGQGLQIQANYTWSPCIDTVSNGGFLPFAAGGILSPIPGDLQRDSRALRLRRSSQHHRKLRLSTAGQCGWILGSCGQRLAGLGLSIPAQRLAFFGPKYTILRKWKRYREWQWTAVRKRCSGRARV